MKLVSLRVFVWQKMLNGVLREKCFFNTVNAVRQNPCITLIWLLNNVMIYSRWHMQRKLVWLSQPGDIRFLLPCACWEMCRKQKGNAIGSGPLGNGT